ncbi:MAG: Fur family transcriptional regulator [Campylobacterota bacterium]|nr:Fur family transcriptional regulator [Campylobacterota bacterium]
MNEYTTILREHHLKATPQRLAMLESIDYYGHINIDKLYEDIQKKFSSISLATVYKNINAMTKNMILFEVKLPNEKSVYEIVKEKHSHLLCQSCGKVTDIETNINDILGDIEQKENFIIIQTDLVLSGICKECIN